MDDVAQVRPVADLARESLRGGRLEVLGSCASLALGGAALWWAHIAPSSSVGSGVRSVRLFVVVSLVLTCAALYRHRRMLFGARSVLAGIEAGDGERHEARVGPGSQVLELLDDSEVEVVMRASENWFTPGRDVVVHGRLREGGLVALELPFGVRWCRIASLRRATAVQVRGDSTVE